MSFPLMILKESEYMPEKDLMVVKQLPVIIAQIDEIGKRADGLIAEAESLVVTADSKQAAKKIKAAINKEKELFDQRRIAIKNEIMQPYLEVEARFKEEVSKKYDKAYKILNDKVLEIENAEITEKTQEVREFFSEHLASSGIDFISFEMVEINVTLSASIKSLKDKAKSFIDRVVEDVALIDTQEYREEIMVEYKASLNVSNAIRTVTARRQAIDAEKEKTGMRTKAQADGVTAEAEVDRLLAPEVTEPEEKFTFKFFVEDTKDRLKALVAFMKENDYTFGDITE